jgi:hypothetical protein
VPVPVTLQRLTEGARPSAAGEMVAAVVDRVPGSPRIGGTATYRVASGSIRSVAQLRLFCRWQMHPRAGHPLPSCLYNLVELYVGVQQVGHQP